MPSLSHPHPTPQSFITMGDRLQCRKDKKAFLEFSEGGRGVKNLFPKGSVTGWGTMGLPVLQLSPL
jgi:hypothetical protein